MGQSHLRNRINSFPSILKYKQDVCVMCAVCFVNNTMLYSFFDNDFAELVLLDYIYINLRDARQMKLVATGQCCLGMFFGKNRVQADSTVLVCEGCCRCNVSFWFG